MVCFLDDLTSQRLAESNADINSKTNDDGDHPIWIAAQNGHAEVIKLLVSLGADADEATYDDVRHAV